jgi:lysophospholipase L1-like esterase
MTSLAPFGPYFSADGVHPNAAGQTILSRAAAQALNNRYGLGIPLP